MVKHFYVGKVPDAETTKIPSDVFDLYDITKYGIVNFAGLDRPDADISRSALAGANASRISGSQISERNIVLTIRPWIAAETNRQELYDNLPFDTDLRFYIVTENQCVFIDGYVEKLGGGGFTKDVTDIQLSILCPFPWFQSVKLHKTNLTKNTPTKITNDGDIPCGINFYVPDTYESTASHIREFVIDINGEKFSTDVGNIIRPPVTVSTIPGKKKYLASATIPAFATLSNGSKWVTLAHGSNVVTLDYFEVLSDVDTAGTKGIAQNVFSWRDTYSGV